MPYNTLINRTILCLAQINEKILDGSFDSCLDFPQEALGDLCISYSKNLQVVSINVFPDICKNKRRPYPDIFAIGLTLLLRSTNIDLYNECHVLEDILIKLNNPIINYDIIDQHEIRLDENAFDNRHCICSHYIETVYMCYANNNHLILGSTCINKTTILSLIEKRKLLEKKICVICSEHRKPANTDIDICVPCSKKIYCAVCKAHSIPSKANPELCSKCSKCCVICPTEECNQYRNKSASYCSPCMLVFEEKRRLEQLERKKQADLEYKERMERKRLENERTDLETSTKMNNILRQLEEARVTNKKECLDCHKLIPIDPAWRTRCVPCYITFKNKQELNKQECLKLQKEISDLNK